MIEIELFEASKRFYNTEKIKWIKLTLNLRPSVWKRWTMPTPFSNATQLWTAPSPVQNTWIPPGQLPRSRKCWLITKLPQNWSVLRVEKCFIFSHTLLIYSLIKNTISNLSLLSLLINKCLVTTFGICNLLKNGAFDFISTTAGATVWSMFETAWWRFAPF